MLTVTYDKKNEVALGNTLSVKDTQSLPEFHITFNPDGNPDPTILGTAAESATFTLALTDPDAPSKTDKDYSEYLHYLVTGIKVKAPSSDDPAAGIAARLAVENAHTLMPYMGPGPPAKTGKHRYVFVLLRETGATPTKFEGDRPRWGADKPSKGLDLYAKKHGLIPVAINFFYAQNEEQ